MDNSRMDLHQACEKLGFTIKNGASETSFDPAMPRLNELWDEYSYAEVLGELSGIWSLETAVSFFEKADLKCLPQKEIKTIATFFRKAYSGGIERVQAQLMDLWTDMGYKVVLFTEEPANELDFPYPGSVKRYVIPACNDIKSRLIRLQELLISEKVDIFINHGWINPSVIWETSLLNLMKIPYALYIHNPFTEAFPMGKNELCQPEVFKLCNLLITLSEMSSRFYQMCGCDSYTVQNPVPEDLLSVVPVCPLSGRNILWIGRFADQKRPMDALRIFKLVHDRFPDAKLDMVGGDEAGYMSAMKEYINDNALSESIVLHGVMSASDLAGLYSSATCVLNTSSYEGYPMVPLESKAYGLPIIMYDLPYLTILKDRNGILTLPVGNVSAMAETLIKVLSDESCLNDLGKSSRESFENILSYDQKKAWGEIFDLCSYGSAHRAFSEAYHDPRSIPEDDRYILPMLMDAMKQGYDTREAFVRETTDYRLGNKLLKIPRALKRLLKN